VAYLECVKGLGGQGTKGKPLRPQKLKLFIVNEFLNFDVLEEKISKTAKMPLSKIMVS